jgi:hypothetical protein
MQARGWAPRSEEDYATHVPVLVGIGAKIPVRRILELGSGDHSTGIFLDRSLFPDVTVVDSVETDPSWFLKVSERFGHDERLSLQLVDGSVASHLLGMDLSRYDLVMVDDSDSLEARAASIRAVTSAAGQGQLVVVHDAEISEYRKAARALRKAVRFATLTPQTLVGWKGRSPHGPALRSLRVAMDRVDQRPAPSDAGGWARILADV